MKKVKFMVLATVCMTLFAFGACSDDDEYNPDDVVKLAFEAQFPDATRVEWEKKGVYIVADCTINGRDTDVWFAVDGVWKMTETELSAVDVPEAVTLALAEKDYANWKIDNRDRLEYPAKATEYVIEVEQGVEEFDLYFSETGTLLKTVDVSNNDDTHWPE